MISKGALQKSLSRLKNSIKHITMDWDKQKPQYPEPYCQWFRDKHGKKIDGATKSNYNHVVTQIKDGFEKSQFWVTFVSRLGSYQDEYIEKRGGYLLYPYGFSPKLDMKEYDNFFHKTYRKNCLLNKKYPLPPDTGWILPGNWYSQVNDIVRTIIVVKYLDGLEFVLSKILELCDDLGIPPENRRFDREVKSAGYYAIHFYIRQSFQIPDLKWKEQKREVEIEIQITTEIQDVIKKLLHVYYVRQRNWDIKEIEQRQKELPWHHEYEEFSVHYLGHILHYVEGMIMEIRIREGQRK